MAIEVDFFARALECMVHTIAMMQNIPHLRSAEVHMSDLDCATVESRLHASGSVWRFPTT